MYHTHLIIQINLISTEETLIIMNYFQYVRTDYYLYMKNEDDVSLSNVSLRFCITLLVLKTLCYKWYIFRGVWML